MFVVFATIAVIAVFAAIDVFAVFVVLVVFAIFVDCCLPCLLSTANRLIYVIQPMKFLKNGPVQGS